MGGKSGETMNTQGLKHIIRQRILSQREQLSAGLRSQFSVEIAQRILLMPKYQAAQFVLGYMNFGTEFESEILMRQALADGKQLLLPKVNRATNELDVYRVTDLQADLAPGPRNIREPVPERCTRLNALAEVDFILLPGVAFGRDGARLGYGGGYYDRLLARLEAEGGTVHRPVLVASAYSIQLADDIPQEATDRRVQWVATENEMIACDT